MLEVTETRLVSGLTATDDPKKFAGVAHHHLVHDPAGPGIQEGGRQLVRARSRLLLEVPGLRGQGLVGATTSRPGSTTSTRLET